MAGPPPARRPQNLENPSMSHAKTSIYPLRVLKTSRRVPRPESPTLRVSDFWVLEIFKKNFGRPKSDFHGRFFARKPLLKIVVFLRWLRDGHFTRSDPQNGFKIEVFGVPKRVRTGTCRYCTKVVKKVAGLSVSKGIFAHWRYVAEPLRTLYFSIQNAIFGFARPSRKLSVRPPFFVIFSKLGSTKKRQKITIFRLKSVKKTEFWKKWAREPNFHDFCSILGSPEGAKISPGPKNKYF